MILLLILTGNRFKNAIVSEKTRFLPDFVTANLMNKILVTEQKDNWVLNCRFCQKTTVSLNGFYG
jgi:hypothetical protein